MEGNVFEQLGCDSPNVLELKAKLVLALSGLEGVPFDKMTIEEAGMMSAGLAGVNLDTMLRDVKTLGFSVEVVRG